MPRWYHVWQRRWYHVWQRRWYHVWQRWWYHVWQRWWYHRNVHHVVVVWCEWPSQTVTYVARDGYDGNPTIDDGVGVGGCLGALTPGNKESHRTIRRPFGVGIVGSVVGWCPCLLSTRT